jgi:hypothetical protein
MFDVVGVLGLLSLTVLFAWLGRRAWRAEKKWVRWTGVPVASLLALLLVVGLGAALLGFYRLNRTYDNPPTQLAVTPGPENVERAERYVKLCATCHAEDNELPMAGADFMGEGAPPMGTFYAGRRAGHGARGRPGRTRASGRSRRHSGQRRGKTS